MSKLEQEKLMYDGNQLSTLMSSSNAGEGHVVYRDDVGDIVGLLVICQGDKAGDVLAAIQDLIDNEWEGED